MKTIPTMPQGTLVATTCGRRFIVTNDNGRIVSGWFCPVGWRDEPQDVIILRAHITEVLEKAA